MSKRMRAYGTYLGVLMLGFGLTMCGHPAFAGGDDSSPIVRRPRHAPVLVLPPVAAPIEAPAIAIPPPVVKVEDPKPVYHCDDRRYKVIINRDDLYREGCHWIPSFGQSGENPAQDDVSPN